MSMSCYISYSWDDDINDKLINEIKSQIEKMSNYKINVIYDRRNFHTGDDILAKEKQIEKSDSIVVFFTPSYKTKVINEDLDRGVYREYKIIKMRLEKGDNNIIPILLSGDFDKSITDEFKNVIYEDIRSIQTQIYEKQGKTTFSDSLELAIKKIVKETIKRTEVYAWLKDNSFNSLEEEYNALFLNASADPSKKLPRDCIIKTKSYDYIINQSGYFVIGRKGSGKTTLLEAIQGYDAKLYLDKYKISSSINAESINLAYIYEELIQKVKVDFNIIPMPRMLDVFWEVFLVLQCIYNIGIELEHFRIDDSDERFATFKKIVGKLKRKLGNTDSTLDNKSPKDSIFMLAAECIVNYFKDGIFKSINTTNLSASAHNNFSSEKILQNEFGRKLFIDFSNALNKCNKKILLALDGFDPHSEDFRLETTELKTIQLDEYKMRKNYEIFFYRELMITIGNLKKGIADNSIAKIFDAVDFCIIIPRDRYDEIKDKKKDRDFAKRDHCCLSWDAYDLLDMLIKRLEHYYRIKTDSNNANLLERFNAIIKKELPNIPSNIDIDINGFDIPISTFNYILRLSFWRPRGIIKNFAIIMKLAKHQVPQSQETVQEILKTLLTNNTRDIIDQEFIGEYNQVYTNLEYVLKRFKGMNLIVDYTDFCEKISKINVESIYDISTRTAQDKIELLYKLGVLGLYLDDRDVQQNGYGYHICFVFNEGMRPWNDFKNEAFETLRTKIIFNPIFLKYLDLNINTKELICNYSWEYIYKNHLMQDSIDRI